LVVLLQSCDSGKGHSKEEEQAEEEHKHDEGDGHAHEGDGHAHDEGDGEIREDALRLTSEAMKRAEIRLQTPQQGTLSQRLEISAEVELNPDRVAHISPLVASKVLSVDVQKGDVVKAGDKLVELRSVELGEARAELRRARAMKDVAERNQQRQRQLRKEGISSERSLLESELAFDQANAELEAARSRLLVFGLNGGNGPDMTIVSPIDGTIIARHATRGESATSSDTLFIVADLSTLWIVGQVPERTVSGVSVGMPATLSLGAFPGRTWTGKVDYVGSVLEESTRSLPIRVEVDNPDGLLRPGFFGSLSLSETGTQGTTLLVPLVAIQTLDDKKVVFVSEDESGTFKAQPVSLGAESKDFVEVIDGLSADSKVVVEGAFLLKSEMIRGQLGHGHAH
jgi:cobalt-zinc-cadmium efflux system membrane fusion protein